MVERETLYSELAELSVAFGPPGHEREVAEILARRLSGMADTRRDRLGSVVAELPGDGPRVMLAAHLDEVGLMVRAVTADGYLKFLPLGSWWRQVLLSGVFRIRGRLGEVRGVIGAKPPHFLRDRESRRATPVEEMFLDVGARTPSEVAALGLGPGDPAVPDLAPLPLQGGAIIMGKALDDRVGIQAVIETIRRLASGGHPNTLLATGTAQEEIGARGARTAGQMLHPDVCLVVEGAPADDLPGEAREMTQGALGRGPQIRVYDSSMMANGALVALAVREAESLGLPYQVAIREKGKTDGGAVHLTDLGVPSLVIGIPVCYAHSQAGLSALADLEGAIELLVGMVRRLDGRTVAEL